VTAPVRLQHVRKTYPRGVVALDDVSVDFLAGTMTAVMGPSGSGKSTLLHCAAGLDEPDTGEVSLAGVPLAGRTETELTLLRRTHAAFVFQQFNLMPALTVRQNVTLPALLAGTTVDDAWVTEVLDRVGLGDRDGHRPGELSGGQQQRVAIARALASRAEVVFADEPTGALDSRTALAVLALLRQLTGHGQSIVLVTHDPVAAAHADEVLFLVDGRIVSRLSHPTVDAVATQLIGTTR
jgi:putative ABC transport system ATP-binding protein